MKSDVLYSSTKRPKLVKGYGFMYFLKNMSKNIGKIVSKNLIS